MCKNFDMSCNNSSLATVTRDEEERLFESDPKSTDCIALLQLATKKRGCWNLALSKNTEFLECAEPSFRGEIYSMSPFLFAAKAQNYVDTSVVSQGLDRYQCRPNLLSEHIT